MAPVTIPPRREPDLLDQTVVVIGGSSGIGLETARRVRAEGANVVLAAREKNRLNLAARETGAEGVATLDVNDPRALSAFFHDLSGPVDHVLVTAGAPHYGPTLELSPEEGGQDFTEHLMLAVNVARCALGKIKAGGSLTFMSGTGARRPRKGLAILSTVTVALPTLIANLALELAPVRVNLIAAGFVDTPLQRLCSVEISTGEAKS